MKCKYENVVPKNSGKERKIYSLIALVCIGFATWLSWPSSAPPEASAVSIVGHEPDGTWFPGGLFEVQSGSADPTQDHHFELTVGDSGDSFVSYLRTRPDSSVTHFRLLLANVNPDTCTELSGSGNAISNHTAVDGSKVKQAKVDVSIYDTAQHLDYFHIYKRQIYSVDINTSRNTFYRITCASTITPLNLTDSKREIAFVPPQDTDESQNFESLQEQFVEYSIDPATELVASGAYYIAEQRAYFKIYRKEPIAVKFEWTDINEFDLSQKKGFMAGLLAAIGVSALFELAKTFIP